MDKTLIIKLLFSTAVSQTLLLSGSLSAVCLASRSVILHKDQLGAKCCQIGAAFAHLIEMNRSPLAQRLGFWRRVALSAIIASSAPVSIRVPVCCVAQSISAGR